MHDPNEISPSIYEHLRAEFGLWGPAAHETAESLLLEEFRDISRVNDWRNYVGIGRYADESARKRFVAHWCALNPIKRYIQFVKAFDQASREEWD